MCAPVWPVAPSTRRVCAMKERPDGAPGCDRGRCDSGGPLDEPAHPLNEPSTESREIMAESIRVLGISGSLRKGSYNTALLRAAIALAPANMTFEVADLRPIPLY